MSAKKFEFTQEVRANHVNNLSFLEYLLYFHIITIIIIINTNCEHRD
jgi:hypothetical protein